ncbi:MAG: formate/nitrite transporter family protein [Gemmatimonadales bacterium]
MGKETSPADKEHSELAHDHPLEEAQKSYHTILEQEITDATQELERPAGALLLSGLAAGLDLGFTPFAIAVSTTLTKDVLSKPIQDLLNANLYAIGFIFVTLGRSELFTEHTTEAVLPVLARRASVIQLLRLWGLVLVANLVGGALFAFFTVNLGPALGVIAPATFAEMATPLITKSASVTLFSAVGGGWLMGLLTWQVVAARDTTSQILVIWVTTFVIALGKLHHSIAGSIEVLMSVFSGGATGADLAHFLVWSVLGNAIGGALFVGLLKFSAVSRSKG